MHHLGLLLILLLLAILVVPAIGHGLAILAGAAGPTIAAAPGVGYFGNLVAPALVAVVLVLGVLVVAVLRLVCGV